MKSKTDRQLENGSQPDGAELHRRLLLGDPLASLDIAEACIAPVYAHLKIHFPTTDPTLLSDATNDAYFNYLAQPTRFDPTRRSLLGYLKMSAEGDLQNALDKQKRHQRRLISLEKAVELPQDARNNPVEAEFIGRQTAVERIEARRDRQVAELRQAAYTDLDRQLLALLQAGERRTAPYARLLGLEALNLPEQRRLVKQHKDRLKGRLRRGKEKEEEEEGEEEEE